MGSNNVAESLGRITDLCDPKRRVILVRYPAWVSFILLTIGVAAIVLTGFLGYPAGTNGTSPALANWDKVFVPPWPLYIWIGLLAITLQASVLRHSSLRSLQGLFVGFTIGAFLLVGIPYFACLSNSPCRLPVIPSGPPPGFLHDPAIYTALNYGILLLFYGYTAWRLIQAARGRLPNRRIDLGTGEVIQLSREELPKVSEVLAGDLIPRGLLALILAALVVVLPATGVTTCSQIITLAGICQARSLQPLWAFDVGVALGSFFLGLLLLAYVVQHGLMERLTADDGLPAPAPVDETSDRLSLGEEFWLVLGSILLGREPQSLVGRRIGESTRRALLALIWPFLIIAVALGAAFFAFYTRNLVHPSDSACPALRLNPLDGTGSVNNLTLYSPSDVVSNIVGYLSYVVQHTACTMPTFGLWVLTGAGTVALVLLATAAALDDRHVVADMLGFLRLVGYPPLLYFFIISFALGCLNLLIVLSVGCFFGPTGLLLKFCTAARARPFAPGLLTLISLGVGLLPGLRLLGRQRAGRQPRDTSPSR